ncbi:rab GTPase-activating protein 1-like isoform X2 [Condylostylus longicornis]|uniref:rab GTPase-activating protein 1-like isoform X2 n=1 Tax=Condylostylus longicornis TaxID=2530218 RepID=UPI00244DEA84|nr:rab GTPase-activating protein 1-like isoform X2 [Condylostylus longicornis]
MEDNLSTKSSDSLSTSGEYEIVPEAPILNTTTITDITNNIVSKDCSVFPKNEKKTTRSPTLNIANNGDFSALEKDMNEVIKELDTEKSLAPPKNTNKSMTLPLVESISKEKTEPVPIKVSPTVLSIQKVITQSDELLSPKSDLSTPDINRVGHSVFYDCIDTSPLSILPANGVEKQDKPEKSDSEEDSSNFDRGYTTFSGIVHLGAVNINSPASGPEVQMRISELNSSTTSAGHIVSVRIPNNSDGSIVLYDAETDVIVYSFEIQRIVFYTHGPPNSPDQACFAFTWSHGESYDTAMHKCHVFRCHTPEAITQISACFTKAFVPPVSLTGSVTSAVDNNSVMMASITSDQSGNPLNTASYDFIVTLSFSEKIDKKTYSPVTRDKGCFKLHCNTDKEVTIIVKQTPSDVLQPLFIERCFGVLLSPGKLIRQADMQLLDMVSMGYQRSETVASQALCPYRIRAECKAKEKAFKQLNFESSKTFLTVAVDLVIKGIQEPVRFVIETAVSIQPLHEIRIMDRLNNLISKSSMSLRFYLQLKRSDDELWEVNSIDPSEEIIEQSSTTHHVGASTFFNNLSKIVKSSSIMDDVEDDCPSECSSDGDEPLLSGTGEVSKDCSPDLLHEWNPVLKEWDNEKRPKALAALVRCGIPEALRGKIWQKLANVENKDMTDTYRILITKETKCEAMITKDINRTFPAHKYFRENGGTGQDSLFKVSKAYAVYDMEVGYCQGLSFIAASLLLHMPEEDSFSVLVSIMYEYGLRELYKQGFETLYLHLYQLNRLIKDLLPKLYEHFERNGIETHMFASQWFLTLFNARFPLYFVFHVLDIFLLDGMTILFQVAITLLQICENELRQLDFEGILKYFRVSLPRKCRKEREADRVLKMACDRKIKKLKQYEEEFIIRKRNEELLEKEAQIYEAKFGEERKKFHAEIKDLQKKFDDANEKINQNEKRHSNIVEDYKQIINRQEQQITKLNCMLEDITRTVSTCQSCSTCIHQGDTKINKDFKTALEENTKKVEMPLGPLDPLHLAQQRVRELELELAAVKLAKVEAECENQELNHQLNTTLTEMQSNRNSWQPWLSKTINTIQEKVTTTRRDTPTFQSYTNSSHNQNLDNAGSQDKNSTAKQQMEASPKLPAKYQPHNNIRNNSVDLKRDRPILQSALSFTSLK